MLFKGGPVKGDVRGEMGFALVGHNTGEAEAQCLAIESSMAAYNDAMAMQGETAYINMGKAAQNELLNSGYKYVKGYKRAATDDMDSVRWWVKDGACVIAFQGSDSLPDFVNNWDPAPVDKWNMTQVHRGLTVELEPLLTMMQPDFPEMNSTCNTSVMVTGHSLGGGLAQMFTMALNSNADLLKAGFTADSLYTYGAMPVSAVGTKNDQAADGCFPGALFFNAENSTGTVRVDIVRAPQVGAPLLQPIKYIKKVLLFNYEAPMVIPCGEDIPASVALYPGFDLHDPRIYATNIGCGYIDRLQIAAAGDTVM